MKFYRVSVPGQKEVYSATLGDAKVLLCANVEPNFRDGARIDLIDLSTERAALVTLLNSGESSTAERTWMVTRRGGLNEVEAGT